MVAMIRFTAILSVVVALTAGPVQADARESYRQGIEAIKRQDWPRAVGHMQEAIGEKPEESAGAFRRYLPHYHLGLALFESGDCPRALAAWSESVSQDVITGEREMGKIREGRRVCTQREQEAEKTARAERDQALARELSEEISRAQVVAARLSEARARPDLEAFWESGTPSRNDQATEALRLLENARDVISGGSGAVGRALMLRAKSWAVSARGRMERLLAHAEAGQPVAADNSEQLEQAKELLRSIANLEPWPAQLASAAAEVADIVSKIDDSSNSEASPDADALMQELDEAFESLGRIAAPPPDPLQKAASSFIGANYAQTIELLSGAALESDRERAHSHLLLAASRFALFLIGERADESLLELTRADVAACRELDETLIPTELSFSPLFVSFFEQEGKDGAFRPLRSEAVGR